MAKLKIAGKYTVGFNRMKMGLGNSVLVFYPVNDSEVTQTIPAYEYPDKILEGQVKQKNILPFAEGMILNRVVSQLCPDAPLATHFATGVRNLIPMIFCHGNKVNAEEHYGVPMIMASHGYCVFSPTFMDKTACHATDKDGNDIPWEDNPLPHSTTSGEINQEFWDYFRDHSFKQRVAEVNKMAE